MATQFSDQTPVPFAVITLATHESASQPILFSSQWGYSGKYNDNDECNVELHWSIKAIDCQLMRDWSQSGARITLACNLPEANASLPRLPRVDMFRGGQYPYLTVDDEIRIYAGYKDSVSTAIDVSLLDESVINSDDPTLPKPSGNINRAVPIFWGFIDKIDYQASYDASGHQIILSCRDRTRLLTDTHSLSTSLTDPNFAFVNKAPKTQGKPKKKRKGDISKADSGFNTSSIAGGVGGVITFGDFGALAKEDAGDGKSAQGNDIGPYRRFKPLRQDEYKKYKRIFVSTWDGLATTVLLNVNGLNGRDNLDDIKGKMIATKTLIDVLGIFNLRIKPNFLKDVLSKLPPGIFNSILECEYFDLFNNPITEDDDERILFVRDPSLFVRRATFKLMDRYSRPRLHHWVARPNFVKSTGYSWLQHDNTPMKVIKWIAKVADRPMDFFASHINGDFCLVPRVMDTSGFYDEDRMYRTYFFGTYPKSLSGNPPCKNQLILRLRSFNTIIGSFNRFTIVDNSNVSGAGLSVLEGTKLTIDSVPSQLQDRNPSPPCRHKVLYDGNLSSYANSFGGAAIHARSVSAQLARDINGVDFTILGDPTFYPGEAVRIYNNGIYNDGMPTKVGNQASQIKREIATNDFNDKYFDKAPYNSYKEDISNTLPNKELSEEINKINNTDIVPTDIDNLVLPVYMVREVSHRLNKDGFMTHIIAVSDLGTS